MPLAGRKDGQYIRGEMMNVSTHGGWMPIETAPADGEFLVYSDAWKTKIQAARFRGELRVIGNVFAFDIEPATHWMPLPDAPIAARAAVSGDAADEAK